MASPLVSIIIPVHNNAPTLGEQLDAVEASMTPLIPAEVLVVDNLSTDGSGVIAAAWAAGKNVRLRVIQAFERANEPYARNVGAAAASAPILLFCDGDDVVGESWIASMCEALSTHRYATGPLETRGINPDWLAQARGHSLFDSMPLLFERVPFAHGCNIGIHRDTLEELGGFDERFTAGCDIDLAIRAWRAGIVLRFHPEAVVRYRLRRSLRDLYKQGRSYGRIQPMIRLSSGIPVDRAHWLRRLRRVAWLLRKLPRLYDKTTRTRWIWVLSLIDGEIRGTFKYRNASY